MAKPGKPKPFTFVVEHLDPELGEWSKAEYLCIADETAASECIFMLTSLAPSFNIPADFTSHKCLETNAASVEDLFPGPRKDCVCLLDPASPKALSPPDADSFDVFLFGGILGDHPPRDRTSELRKKGYATRNLGSVQMTTDTAVRVTRTVIKNQTPLDKIPFLDFPEIQIDKHESVVMPFRYVKTADGKPVLPNGMVELLAKDADKSVNDLF
ncbi:MAG: hypothetical protein M1814_006813 [Vezdaea aestivalis]|nr:MAG: hypothetical protein M1814_006813 [Vezdaea aestivalis]